MSTYDNVVTFEVNSTHIHTNTPWRKRRNLFKIVFLWRSSSWTLYYRVFCRSFPMQQIFKQIDRPTDEGQTDSISSTNYISLRAALHRHTPTSRYYDICAFVYVQQQKTKRAARNKTASTNSPVHLHIHKYNYKPREEWVNTGRGRREQKQHRHILINIHPTFGIQWHE